MGDPSLRWKISRKAPGAFYFGAEMRDKIERLASIAGGNNKELMFATLG